LTKMMPFCNLFMERPSYMMTENSLKFCGLWQLQTKNGASLLCFRA